MMSCDSRPMNANSHCNVDDVICSLEGYGELDFDCSGTVDVKRIEVEQDDMRTELEGNIGSKAKVCSLESMDESNAVDFYSRDESSTHVGEVVGCGGSVFEGTCVDTSLVGKKERSRTPRKTKSRLYLSKAYTDLWRVHLVRRYRDKIPNFVALGTGLGVR